MLIPEVCVSCSQAISSSLLGSCCDDEQTPNLPHPSASSSPSRPAAAAPPIINPLHYHDNFNCEGGSRVRWKQSYCPPHTHSPSPPLSFCHRQPTQTPGDDDPFRGRDSNPKERPNFSIRRPNVGQHRAQEASSSGSISASPSTSEASLHPAAPQEDEEDRTEVSLILALLCNSTSVGRRERRRLTLWLLVVLC